MTPQEIFDTVVNHLNKQKKPARDVNGGCFYRAPDGTKCAVGALISDELYDRQMDGLDEDGEIDDSGMGVHTLLKKFPNTFPDWFKQNEQLLADLQNIHDSFYNWTSNEVMRGNFNRIAEEYGLNADSVKTLDIQVFP